MKTLHRLSANVHKFPFREVSPELSHNLGRGAWIADNFAPNRMQSLVAWIKNPIAFVGGRATITPPLIAHLAFGLGAKLVEVDRAYWLRRTTNTVSIQPGQKFGAVIGSLEHSSWVLYANPYDRSPFEGILPEVIAPLGEKFVMPRMDSLEITLSPLGTDSMETLAQ